MEAYFDPKAKRWVFPGETPEETPAGPPPPPPTSSKLTGPPGSQGGDGAPAPQPTPGLDANDPLAALMAPPQASIGSRRHTMAGVAGGPPPLGLGGGPNSEAGGGPPSGGLGWTSAGGPSLSGGSGTGRPSATKSPFPPGGKFTVFAPKAPVESSGGSTGGSPRSGAPAPG